MIKEEQKIIEDADVWIKEQKDFKKYKFNRILYLIGLSVSAIFLVFIVSAVSSCIVITCENSNKYALEKQKLDAEQQEKIRQHKEEFYNSEMRAKQLEDCDKLKELRSKENPKDSHSLWSVYNQKYINSCISSLVVE